MPQACASSAVRNRPRDHQLGRAHAPDEPRKALGPSAAGHEAELRLGQAEARVVRCDHEVARQDQLEPAAEREPLHRGDDRLRERGEAIGHRPAHVHERAIVVHRDVDVVLDVGSGGEGAARSVQDPDDRVVARLEPVERAPELLEDRAIERVELVGPVQRDPRDLVALCIGDRLLD